MSIRPIDIQTSVTGSTQVSDFRQRQQHLEQIHQENSQGSINDLERKSVEEVNTSERDAATNPDGSGQNSAGPRKHKDKKESSGQEEEKSQPTSDGIRGRKLDFSV